MTDDDKIVHLSRAVAMLTDTLVLVRDELAAVTGKAHSNATDDDADLRELVARDAAALRRRRAGKGR